ncbi:hypothetical protein QE388_000253 [Microbacterium sp. SORGH_AS 969]|nr:hypothetical protein [Microbacterium sp. SORGH_AS_0969]
MSPHAVTAPDCRFDGRRQLERDLAVAHPAGQVTEGDLHLFALARDDVEVVGDAHAVAETQRAPVDEGGADGCQTGTLSGVHGRGEELFREVVEGLAVTRRQEAVLGTRDVEAHHASAAPRDRELGDVARVVVVTQRGEQLTDSDVVTAGVRGILSRFNTLLHGVHDLVEAEASGEVLFRSPPHLAVHDAVGREIFDELLRRAHEALARLHHTDRDRELLEVVLERAAVDVVGEPRLETLRVVGGQVEIDLVGQLEHRLRAETPVEVIVQ